MSAVIFDFDGTIADSFDTVVGIFEQLTKRPEKLTTQDLAELRNYPLQDIAEKLGVPLWKAPLLLFRGRRMMTAHIPNLHIFTGMGRVIEELAAEGHSLYIMSSNSTRNIKKFLKQHHLYKYFADIRGGAGLFSKAKALEAIMQRENLEPKDCIYVGDETRDIEGAKAADMRVVAVTWGFADKALLAAHQPTGLADTPQDIVRILEEI